MRVGLTYNLKENASLADEHSAEWDLPETIDAIANALSREHEVIWVLADADAYEKLRHSRADIVFNVAEGKDGPNREAHLPAILEFLRIPYTGSDSLTLSLCLNKARTKEILFYHGIPTPDFQVFHASNEPLVLTDYPMLVKPLWEGSSIGIHDNVWVENEKELRSKMKGIIVQHHQPAIVEEALTGREFTVALLGNGTQLKVLPLVEVMLDALPHEAHPLYSYEAKWIWDTPEKPLDIFHCPAQVEDVLKGKIEGIAKAAFRALGCRDWCRIDVRLDREGNPSILEVNPLPGILPNPRQNSCFPKAARAAGMDYPEMVLSILGAALERCGMLESVGSSKRR
ncbi:MAG: ATP-grasp domain-containing protein [Chlamydiae bacterium]|nr:ATP-grasp domain-containing protein [Chlamydiota bacterium]MBI3265494.1 ATP-grasp domain-containing protein [Chlamydiota bacterium]